MIILIAHSFKNIIIHLTTINLLHYRYAMAHVTVVTTIVNIIAAEMIITVLLLIIARSLPIITSMLY